MRVRSLVLLPFIILISSLGMNCTAIDDKALDTETTGRISLLGCDQIQLPEKFHIPPVGESSPGRHPSDELAVYSRGMPVEGNIETVDGEPPGIDACACTVCIAPLGLSAYLTADPGREIRLVEATRTEALECNGSGFPPFSKTANLSFSIKKDKMADWNSGLYAIYALDRNRSIVIPAQAFFLTEGKALLQAEDSYPSGDPLIKINLSTGREDNRKKLFAAVIMPRKEYDNATIRLVANESKPWPVLALSLGSRYMEAEANPATLQGQLMDLITLMPENSAISVQVSTQSAVDLILLADEPWQKGEYVLNCAIYVPGAGLQGLKQKIINVY